MRFFLFFLLAISYFNGFGQGDWTVEKSFLIIHASKSYDSALNATQEATQNLGLEINLRNYFPDKNAGLITNEICNCGSCKEPPGYIPRGRFDDGNYISIEFSSAYNGFTEGLYFVVVSSGEKEKLNSLLPAIKDHYPGAYIKSAPVYVGCMH